MPLAAVLAFASSAWADCDPGTIERALGSSLAGLKSLERDVTDVQSTEGGQWTIYRETDGRVHTIVRIDGGESGRLDTRLSIVNRKTYGIATTRTDYLRHAFIEDGGPNGTARRTTDYFYYCDGKLYIPPTDYFMGDLDAYKARGADMQKMMVLDKDVAGFTKGLAR